MHLSSLPLRLLCGFLFVTGSLAVAAQDAGATESGLKQQARFIEAKQVALLGKTDDAIALFKALADEAPRMDAAFFELGRLQHAAGATDEAIDQVRRAHELRPNEIYAVFLAELYQAGGRHKEGAELYADLIKENPAEEDYYLERAAFQVRAQDVKGAIATYNQLEDRTGVNLELARLKHALYLGQGDQKRAERELQALVDSDEANLRYRHMLAGYYVSQGDETAARRAYADILRLEPADVKAQLALQDVNPARAAGGGDDAALMATLARTDVDLDLKIGKLLPLVNALAARPDAALGQRALALATELQRVHPDEAKASALLGDVRFHTGDYAGAAAAYRATLDLDDSVYAVWEQLLTALYLSNQTTRLRDYAEDALDVYPNRPAVYIYYAIGEALRANFGEAGSLLQQAELMTSRDPEAAARLQNLTAALNTLAGEDGGPVDAKRLPGGAGAPLGLLLNQGDNLTALVAADGTDNTNALFLELLGDAHARAGDKAAAAAAYARAKAAGSRSRELAAKVDRL